MNHLPMLIEDLTKVQQTLEFVIDDLRAALPRCRGTLSTSSLLLIKDLTAAVKLRASITDHLVALQTPLTDDEL
jgi:hypothetical protein